MQQISVIISFYNKIELLKLILDTLQNQTLSDFEVIIADDGSKESIVEQLNQLTARYTFPIRHVWHPDNGWQKNIILNKAVMAAKGEYLIFIDGDCLLDRYFVEEHYNARKEGKVISGRRVLLTPHTSEQIITNGINDHTFGTRLFFQLLRETLFGKQKTRMENMLHIRSEFIRHHFIKERKRFILGCNFSMFKSDLLKVNGFDERFLYPGYGEDIDLWERLTRAGIDTWSYRAGVIMYHLWHKRFDTNYAPNQALLAENNANGITYTPYGINKHE